MGTRKGALLLLEREERKEWKRNIREGTFR